MGLGFGLLSAQLAPGAPAGDWEKAYDEVLRLTEHAESVGFDSIWTTEHHFIDDGYMPSLLVTMGAMAARTSRISIGSGVILAPLHDPLRLAEDAATVQLLSRGRLLLGLGLGWVPAEFAALGADMTKRGKAMEEILDILPQAWGGKPFEHHGSVYDFDTVAVRPTPATPVPVLVGGGAEAAIRRAARKADGIFANVPAAEFRQQVEWATDEMERIGRDPESFTWYHYSILYPADDENTGWDEIGEHLWHLSWKYRDMQDSTRRPGPPPAAPAMGESTRSRLIARSTTIGPPQRIVDDLNEIREAVDVPVVFVARSFFATLPYERQVELMDRLAEDVAPHV
jgi:probable F420-dependent oxidoreductase